eukprot:COSAG05_NODE_727_length_7701_cov_13.129308_2_plen_54_part_00
MSKTSSRRNDTLVDKILMGRGNGARYNQKGVQGKSRTLVRTLTFESYKSIDLT